MNWIRGPLLGRGSFATVNVAIPTAGFTDQLPSVFAVKSSNVHTSYMLKNEKDVLHRLLSSPYVITCFGHDHTFENGHHFYNVFLEYASGGSLADHLKKHGGNLPEPHVRRYTRSILEGLKHIHANGLVHCDVKLQNILVFHYGHDVNNNCGDPGHVKIADFGLAKEKGEKQTKCEYRGTPLFMSPESVNDNEYESPADIWALGCAVVEMVTGKPAWDIGSGSNIWSMLIRIGMGKELPKVPEELSQEGKDFLGKCFVKDPDKRWSADMLLNHPFVTVSLERVNQQLPSLSPTTHFDFSHWDSTVTPSLPCSPSQWQLCSSSLLADRLRRLVTDQRPAVWSDSDSWTSLIATVGCSSTSDMFLVIPQDMCIFL
ncbi:Mitogen-activated protein kinase kinase kinase 17, partial [Mucuna pruriens]